MVSTETFTLLTLKNHEASRSLLPLVGSDRDVLIINQFPVAECPESIQIGHDFMASLRSKRCLRCCIFPNSGHFRLNLGKKRKIRIKQNNILEKRRQEHKWTFTRCFLLPFGRRQRRCPPQPLPIRSCNWWSYEPCYERW